MLHHGLALGPQFSDRSEDITPVLPLDLLDQHGQPHVDTAPIRAEPGNIEIEIDNTALSSPAV